MKCPREPETLYGYASGGGDVRDAARTESHIASCAQCRREAEALRKLCAGLRALPRVEPGVRVWETIRLEAGASPGLKRIFPARFFRLPALAAAAAIAVACALWLRAPQLRHAAAPRGGIGVVEMGSRIARTNLPREDTEGAIASYFSDARRIAEVAVECAASGDAACWSALKERVAGEDMLFRALCLRERRAASRELLDDSIRLMRAIGERQPDELAAGGGALRDEIARMDLLHRMAEGAAR